MKRDLTWPTLILYIVPVPSLYYHQTCPFLLFGGDLQKTIQLCVTLGSKTKTSLVLHLPYRDTLQKMLTHKRETWKYAEIQKVLFWGVFWDRMSPSSAKGSSASDKHNFALHRSKGAISWRKGWKYLMKPFCRLPVNRISPINESSHSARPPSPGTMEQQEK